MLAYEEHKTLAEFFGINVLSISHYVFDTKLWRRKSGKMPKEIQYLVRKFKLVVNHLIEQADARPVKDYYLKLHHPSPQECKDWTERFRDDRDVPPQPPPRRYKEYFSSTPNFGLVFLFFKDNPNLTNAQLLELGGGAWHLPLQNGIVDYMRSLVKKRAKERLEAATVSGEGSNPNR